MHCAQHTHLTIHTEYHTDRGISNCVPSYTLIAACIRCANIIDSQESFRADVKFSTFCYLNTILEENNKNDIAVRLGNRSFFSGRKECPFTVKTQMEKQKSLRLFISAPIFPGKEIYYYSPKPNTIPHTYPLLRTELCAKNEPQYIGSSFGNSL